ncbi:hypothetical protein BV898_07891 [Hypsibius exemplaris]|uniref:Uncharacterized protein n=1 Tax=Hypsibius exemplaris TaxID=2072580 RepID=A0A1W0WRV6_HYPEX|nr:hypothetical protein BV898_07891 [Hypsibius exemplaris]
MNSILSIYKPLVLRGVGTKLLVNPGSLSWTQCSVTNGLATKPGDKKSKEPAAGATSTGTSGSGKAKAGKILATDYKVQEYFQYNPFTFYEYEKNMVKDRLKQPSPSVKEGMAEARK